MKVGIIGAGAVGSACLLSLVLRGSAREVRSCCLEDRLSRDIAKTGGGA